jgi:hypothetical protein
MTNETHLLLQSPTKVVPARTEVAQRPVEALHCVQRDSTMQRQLAVLVWDVPAARGTMPIVMDGERPKEQISR